MAKLIVSVRMQLYLCVKIWWRLQLLLFWLAISHQFISLVLAHKRFMQQFFQQSFTPVVLCAYSLSHFYFSLLSLSLPSFHLIHPPKYTFTRNNHQATFCCDSHKFPHCSHSHFVRSRLLFIKMLPLTKRGKFLSHSHEKFPSRNWKEPSRLVRFSDDSVRRDIVKQLSCSFDDIPQNKKKSYLKTNIKKEAKSFQFQ